MEDWADEAGNEKLFFTITAPSKYHARHAESGDHNSKYNGATPRDTQEYLMGVWSRIRTKLNRDNIPIYGLRVVEAKPSLERHPILPIALSDPEWLSLLKVAGQITIPVIDRQAESEPGVDLQEICCRSNNRFALHSESRSKRLIRIARQHAVTLMCERKA